MALSMDMLAIISQKTPPGPVPNGLKVTAITGPDSLQSPPACPILTVGSFELWPLSYYDNRVSFGIVSYDPKGQVVKQTELPGARYVYKITKDGSGDSGSVTFWGQANQHVTINLGQVEAMLEF